jgi:micrococcal nuclease
MYEYKAIVLKVVDGDTLDVELDLGLHIRHKVRLRLYGINAAERFTVEGKEASRRLAEKIGVATAVTVKTIKDQQEKYGRYLANITLADGTFLNEWMIQEGLAERA